MKGICRKILHVDLSTGTKEIIEPDLNLYQQYLGGRGLAQVYYSASAAKDYTHPQMPLLLFSGALAATGAIASDFATFMTQSPVSGMISACPVAEWGRKLKVIGFDGLIITGKSDYLCGIRLKGTGVSIEEASDFSGFSFSELSGALGVKEGLACIGKASENNVLFSSPVFDGRVLGRGGTGLVWASKNLKYLILEEENLTQAAKTEAMESATQDVLRLIMASPVLTGEYGMGNFGDAALLDLVNAKSFLPSSFYTQTHFKEIEKINAPAFHREYGPVKHSCRNCPVGCGFSTRDGKPFPDYEAIAGFGALLDNPDRESILSVCALCHDEGLEPLAAASVLAFYAKQGNLQMTSQKIIQGVEKIIHCEEEGYLLAKGTSRLALSKGVESEAITVKGMDLPLFDPRGAYGLALSYATGSMGPSIHTAFPLSHELLRKPFATNRLSWDMKAKMLVISEDTHAAAHALGICPWVLLAASLEEYAGVFAQAFGEETTAQDLLRTGEKIVKGEKLINLSRGIGPKQDILPEFFFKEEGSPCPTGPTPSLNKEEFLKALQTYNQIRGS